MKSISLAVAALSTISAVTAAAVDPIVIKGSKFFYKTNGTEFYMKGVAYQADTSNSTSAATFVDPLADPVGCARDIPLISALGMNTIRVYAVNTTSDHSACMNLLQNAGIYVVADLSEPGLSIDRDSPSWDLDLLNRYTTVVDAMANYTNVLGFFAGNEVTNNATNTDASPFVKAAVRDVKAYIKSKNYRAIPVGYATNDDADIRDNLADYFNCGDASATVDFWGYNIYSWCGQSSLQESGYDVRTEFFANYSVPVFFAEYGCNTVKPRAFTEVGALYGSVMSPVWSGGIVYMYFEEQNQFGLVQIDSSGGATKLVDYTNLQKQLAKAGTPAGVKASTYSPSNTAARSCPAAGAFWAASTALPPSPDKDLCDCMVSSLECVPASGVTAKDYGDLFAQVCGYLGDGGCDGIGGNGTTGSYGSYSVCEASARLGWAFNKYYLSQSSALTACNFDGAANVVASTVSSSCKSKISSAGGAAGTGTTTSGGSSGSHAATSSNAASGYIVPSFSVGLFVSAIAVFVSVFAGAGVILL